ncbi:ABC transporter permease subunit [Demequina lignilytica]|uniref:Maltose/maltodextrin transport system permease protein n=1 Tax=Demequina lignilytica TaxID=3051663 RepID=A0AAW7MAH3_9MICO|nr:MULTISPECIES: ABC transporter permease subunit [unclassified Demequina]MDN4478774.1 ABC transporter permease subunit [Demequina sp. SYSU T00039-1]MDN4484127.1 ABC transporter permease subunit [Demequina sp. SYSU T0a273]MDN4488872.1 ABC transporter permease subunit [Demequina sp. SYSU T00039]MDN4490290.1 ABC transporter permease subunit [Demequina sp. SYSU T00068]
MSTGQDVAQAEPQQRPRESHARQISGFGVGFIVKLVLMMLVNALGVAIIMSAWNAQAWNILAISVIFLIVADWVYFSKRMLPLKYIYPGLVFLLVFQVFVMAYTAYVATTNYGAGHNVSQAQAVESALIQDERQVEGSPVYPIAVVRDGDTLGFAIGDDGTVSVGTEEQPLSEVADATVDDSGRPASVPGWEIVPRAELLSDQALAQEVTALRVPVSDEADDGSLRTREGSTASIYRSSLEWDAETETLTNTDTGVVYTPNEEGTFVGDDGSTLPVGYIVNVGFDNFVRAVTDSDLAKPLLRVTVWTFAFAFLTVATSFLLGLFFALIYNDDRLRGKKTMRMLFILPYAFPAFLTALLWRGMLNPEFGVINKWFFFGADINWLGDPWLAKFSLLFVNLWLSYPYWFLVCTGALQSLSSETIEAAKIDGAGKWRQFRSITFPLLMVSTAPLAIASFAFNFNNFTIIYMLTNGGPRFPDTSVPLGATDILISAIYQISGVAGGRADYGLAAALSVVVFIVVGAVSAIAFRQTKKLEEF